MSERTEIAWADSTFNPWIGCTKVGPGCDHCYAETLMDKRHHRVIWGAGNPRSRTSAANWKQPLRWNRNGFCECTICRFRGDAHGTSECPACGDAQAFLPSRRRVFCASLADVFDNEVDPMWRADLFALIALTQNLDWLLLTKRIGNVPQMLGKIHANWQPTGFPMQNIWLGATVVNQEEADRDIPKLLQIPARIRFLSIEPMLGPVDLLYMPRAGRHHDWLTGEYESATEKKVTTRIDWVIAGGESGPKARPAHPDWFRSLRDQCASGGVRFLFKQWGHWAPDETRADRMFVYRDGTTDIPDDRLAQYAGNGETAMSPLGKKAAGRLLDGQEYNGFPQP